MKTTDWLDEQVTETVAEWWRLGCLQGGPIYLYYRESGPGQPGALIAAYDTPEGAKLATPERLSVAWTREQAYARIMEIARRLAILPY